MKKRFVNFCVKQIKKHQNYDDIKLKEIEYGLGSIYITLTKTIVIFALAIILNIFKEMLLVLLFYNLLRITGFGIHAKKSWQCWVTSIMIFLVLPFICRYVLIDKNILLAIYGIFILLIFKNAPADTEKKPIVNKKRRIIYKTICTLTSLILFGVLIYTKKPFLQNAIFFGTLVEVVLISPLTYKIFRLKYNNYKEYLKTHVSTI